MRSRSLALAGVLLVAMFASSVEVTTRAARETITGQVICLVCYTRNKANIGRDHDDGFECARACVRWEGNPVGIVTEAGKVYQFAGGLVANNNAKIASHVSTRVTVTGDVEDRGNILVLTADDVTPAPSK